MIIVVHSVLKSISESLENKSISQIAYYVQYILIVTLIMSNFSDIIRLIKDTIQNLVGFSYTLLPILVTLIMTTRKYNICKRYTASTIIFNNFYRKYNNNIYITNNIGINSTWNNF